MIRETPDYPICRCQPWRVQIFANVCSPSDYPVEDSDGVPVQGSCFVRGRLREIDLFVCRDGHWVSDIV